jgi:hypothetical protein
LAIQHASIPDGQRHEPKGISTATASQVYVANGATSGAWRKVRETDIDYSNPANNLFGWNDIADSQYTSGAPRAISSGARTKLTNNALGSQTNTTRLGNIWSTANNQFEINDLNATYIIEVNAKIRTTATAGTPYIALFEVESANGPTVIRGATQFIKGGSAVNNISINYLVYFGSFINNQALSVFVTPDAAIDIYDVGFIVQRLYREL